MAGAEAQPPGAAAGGRKTDKRGRPVLDPAEVWLAAAGDVHATDRALSASALAVGPMTLPPLRRKFACPPLLPTARMLVPAASLAAPSSPVCVPSPRLLEHWWVA